MKSYNQLDNPTCPKCNAYNAMLQTFDGGRFYYTCRDCNHKRVGLTDVEIVDLKGRAAVKTMEAQDAIVLEDEVRAYMYARSAASYGNLILHGANLD